MIKRNRLFCYHRMERLRYMLRVLLVITLVSLALFCAVTLNNSVSRLESYRNSFIARDWGYQKKLFWSNMDTAYFSGENLDYDSVSFQSAYDKAAKLVRIEVPANEKPMRRLPEAIIIGVSKCGTRALLEYLSLNPYVVTAKREMNFFNNATLYNQGLDWYKEQMPLSYSNQVTLEKSPDYFECVQCPPRVLSMNSSVKLLLLLRDPVERLISQYMQLMDKYVGTQTMPLFEHWVREPSTGEINVKVPSVRVSIYADHVKNWLSHFPRKQILIIDSKMLTKNPVSEMNKVESFLGLKPYLSKDDIYFNESKGFHCMRLRATGKTRCLGATKGRPHIKVEKETLSTLYAFYNPHNERLKNILGFRMSWF
ncbi:heparan sulfate glucosamine 3-O-sulfotransferase 1 [Biomphalaria glabrata]|uniref:Heparan sulfate glucosamine 3-O-sulfotransferase 1-like isoform X1 n=1 Tax=Biomphalaria glabrata TaxID=6526 RepID=A0A9U8EB11_BIOGL|nr:heparan sulfate glucosamine 3-O-sulfotransferase 1-like isoform X1 [Biomphalaria glabrata]XP_013080044.2 heparan sulfate glucosamine 3-O-sulfotransferase 1-like isoform X1 [Biomphalaria glabrata]